MNYKKIYNNLCKSRKYRGTDKEAGYEVHHIKPRSCGGNDEESNLVKLTFREHFIAHKLLTRIMCGDSYYKMYHAYRLMCCKGDIEFNYSYYYDLYKTRYLLLQNHIGVYFINPAILPNKRCSVKNKYLEILIRLNYFGIKKFILPQSIKFYNIGDFTTAKRLTSKLKGKGYLHINQRYLNMVIYEISDKFSKKLNAMRKFDYKPKELSYDKESFDPLGGRRWRCEFNGHSFNNPMTVRSCITEDQIKGYSFRPESKENKNVVFIDSFTFDEYDNSIINEYKEFSGTIRWHPKQIYPFLHTLYHACLKYDAISVRHAKSNNTPDIRVFTKVIKFLCFRFNMTYTPSHLVKGGKRVNATLIKNK